MPTWPPPPWQRLALAVGSGLAYALIFVGVYWRLGFELIALTAIPLVAGGLLYGVRGGVVAWALIVPVNVILHALLGMRVSLFVGEGPVRAAVGLGVAVLVGRLRDLTRALQTEAALRGDETVHREKAESQLRSTLAAVPDTILHFGRDGTVRVVHPDLPDDSKAMPDDPLLGEAAALRALIVGLPAPIPQVTQALQTGEAQVAEYQLSLARGPQELEARFIASGRDEVLAIFRNVTERKKLDEVLRQSDREHAEARMRDQLIAADRHVALGTLAAGAAHEINNPLALVVSNLDLMGQQLRSLAKDSAGRWEPGQLAQFQEMVDEASIGADRVRVIVKDLKTFSRASDNHTDIVDVRSVLDLAISMAKSQIDTRSKLVRDYREVAGVNGNPARLAQIFLNLLINAAQAIPEGRPETNEIRAITRMDGVDAVVVEIQDTGSGISAEARAHLFDPFFTTKGVGVGTGLGLYVCHNLVTELGGTITPESAIGRGTSFQVRLPCAAEPVARS